MIIIQVALQIEARQIIDEFKLKKNVAFNSFEIFESNEILLIISGIGKIKASSAISTAITYSLSKEIPLESVNLLNFGFAGATENFQISSLLHINKISDFETNKNYYPDLIFKSNLEKASLISFNSPVDHNSQLESTLVDMECSGFFEASSIFVAPHQIQSIKIVADHLNPEYYTKEKALQLIDSNLEKIINFIDFYKDFTFNTQSIITDEESNLIENILLDLNATKSQEIKLFDEVKKCKILRDSNITKLLSEFYYEKSSNKNDNKSYYNSLVQLLNSKSVN